MYFKNICMSFNGRQFFGRFNHSYFFVSRIKILVKMSSYNLVCTYTSTDWKNIQTRVKAVVNYINKNNQRFLTYE